MKMLNISEIRRDGAMQPRAELSRDVVSEYAEDMLQGADFPPVDVFHDGKEYWLADGYHRVAAASKNQQRQIKVTVHKGTRRDAILHSVAANSDHGYRRTNEDKRRAVQRVLSDKDWAKWSDREIARQCKVHNSFVSRLRAESPTSVAQRQIERTVTRGGTTYTQNTANIGQSKQEDTQTASVTVQETDPEIQLVSVTFHEPDAPEQSIVVKPAEGSPESIAALMDSLTDKQRAKLDHHFGTAEQREPASDVDYAAMLVCDLPPAREVVDFTPPVMFETTDIQRVEKASAWLAEFVTAWNERENTYDAT